LVITLGANNWVVTWIGHGQITESNIIEKIWAKSVPYIIICLSIVLSNNNSIIDASTKFKNKFI
jgi:hypothetical protein